MSFELGLLWPQFMRHAGPIIGMPFSWEGTAFFIEAIAIGIFLYGWNRLNKWMHWISGVIVGISGVLSGIFVVAANSWMNSPAGFDWVDGKAINIDPVAAMFNDAWLSQAIHMTLAAFVSTSFAVAGVHAFLLIKNRRNAFHQKAVKMALAFVLGPSPQPSIIIKTTLLLIVLLTANLFGAEKLQIPSSFRIADLFELRK